MGKPSLNGAGNYKQGRYIPNHPEKYIGDCNNILYRSGWERTMMVRFDMSSVIKKWTSEPFAIKYISPLDGKEHKYWIDFYVENTDGKKYLVELKPSSSLKTPSLNEKVRSVKKIESYNYNAKNYIINTAKWNAAKDFATKNGIEFIIVTEKDLKLD